MFILYLDESGYHAQADYFVMADWQSSSAKSTGLLRTWTPSNVGISLEPPSL